MGGLILLVMAGYWWCMCGPIWATGLIPIFSLPLMGILSATEVAAQYMKVRQATETLRTLDVRI